MIFSCKSAVGNMQLCVFFFFLIVISHIIETFLLLITKIYRKARDINTSIHIIS